jgi:hypothetical protein
MVGEHAVQSGCLRLAAPPDIGESCHIEKWQRGADWLRGKGEELSKIRREVGLGSHRAASRCGIGSR